MRNGKAAVLIVLFALLFVCGASAPLWVPAVEMFFKVLGYMFLGPIQ